MACFDPSRTYISFIHHVGDILRLPQNANVAQVCAIVRRLQGLWLRLWHGLGTLIIRHLKLYNRIAHEQVQELHDGLGALITARTNGPETGPPRHPQLEQAVITLVITLTLHTHSSTGLASGEVLSSTCLPFDSNTKQEVNLEITFE